MLFKKKMMVGLVLCVLILGAFLPTLIGLKNIPQRTFGDEDDIVIITQAINGGLPNMTLAKAIGEQDFVRGVSPEVFAYSSLNDVPISIRGVDFAVFQAFEGISLTENETNAAIPSVIIGERLSSRLGLGTGDEVTLTGSTKPAFFVARIEASFAGKNDDEPPSACAPIIQRSCWNTYSLAI
jgi:ABC-type lipoprotein release transport system permease subunit